jgi:hypothetical protein
MNVFNRATWKSALRWRPRRVRLSRTTTKEKANSFRHSRFDNSESIFALEHAANVSTF